jgi:hypothetical protein
MRFTQRVAVLGASLILASGCSVIGVDGDLEARLQDQRRAWLSQKLTNYSYELQESCFCADVRPVIITVRDDEVTSVVIKETGEPVTHYLDTYMTITQLYGRLIEWADADPHQMFVNFDGGLHFPAVVSIDFEQYTADEELDLALSNLTVIESSR